MRAAFSKVDYNIGEFVVLDKQEDQHKKFINFDNNEVLLASDNPQYANVYSTNSPNNPNNPNSTPYKYYVLHVTDNGGHAEYCTMSEIGLYSSSHLINV